MAERKLLTDRFLKALPPAPRGQRNEVWDARLPGFGVRVTDAVDADPARRGKAGKITFILRARFAPGAAPTRRPIGTYGAITLEQARTTAGEWRSLIGKGVDPAIVEAEAREKADRERALRIRHSFASVAETFIAEKLSRERGGKRCEHDLRTIFVAAWGERPVSEITHRRRAGDHQPQETHRKRIGKVPIGPHSPVFQLDHRSARLWPDRLALRPSQRRQAYRRDGAAQPQAER
jgi:hypothetical protein